MPRCRSGEGVWSGQSIDPFEQGRRATLNLGHTFGHAIEAHQGYGEWLHGEAVAAGMCMAAIMSHQLGWLSAADVDRITDIVKRANLPVDAPVELSPERFVELMSVDKKVMDGVLRLVLLKDIGHAVITNDYTPEQLVEAIRSSTMNYFSLQDGELYCEAVPLARIAEQEGIAEHQIIPAVRKKHLNYGRSGPGTFFFYLL